MRFFAIVEPGTEPDGPPELFRTADGTPPFELFDPERNAWVEDVSLTGYFVGDDYGAVEIDEGQASVIAAGLLEQVLERTGA